MKRHFTLLVLLAIFLKGFAQLPSGFVKFEVASDLNPTDLAIAPDGRVFVTEKDGLVRIVEAGHLHTDPFIILDVEDYNEQGLGHIALDPAFPTKPYVYLYYTVSDSGGTSHNKVVRVTADGNFAVPGSMVVLYECDPSPATVHNAGALVFGNDGKLYISTGDKGRAFRVQTLESDLGKVLRINPDGSIPADNPFYQSALGKYRAIYALGLRNPFSMALQPETGRMFFCDVGSASWEEVNEVLPGKNYGYPMIEGVKTTEQPPADYIDPFYTYGHNLGCAVVGAAFSPISGGPLPSQYKGKFLFADYCKGYIKMLDPQNANSVTNFATSIDRPIALAVSSGSEIYYIARSGIGGGSEADNTESEQGSLWKIIYTGSEAPFVYQQPQNAWRVAGEDVDFQAKALGKVPLHFRWQKDGADLIAPDSNILTINTVSLADSNASFRCIVTNGLGQDTSAAAFLWVTNNQRPVPEILTPDVSFRYKAGTFVPFSGIATDPETGVVPPTETSWKIDFHHDVHLHPVMTPVSNILSDSFWIPRVGEPSDNVWYRLHFSAKDELGLEKSVSRDIYPLKTPVEVYCDETRLAVNVDGILGNTPYFFNSVAGMERSLSVPRFLDETDSVYIFKRWNNDDIHSFRTFITPDTGVYVAKAEYDKIAKAQGFGLLGEYFNESVPPWGFDEPMLLSRIDSTVNFEWLENSPSPGNIPLDKFTVRWTGQVVPYRNDTLTFYTFTDDGARLWVNDSLLIDHWEPQGGTEYAASLYLEGGKKYPIRFDFLELGGVATAKLLWSTTQIMKSPVPQRQLYPPAQLVPNTLNGFVWLDVDGDEQWSVSDIPISGAAVLLKEKTTQNVILGALTDSVGRYSYPLVLPGIYTIQVLPPLNIGIVIPAYGLSKSGESDEFTLLGEQDMEQNFAFRLPSDPKNPVPANLSWEVSPNPTAGLLVFRKKWAAIQERFHILVFDITGKLCLEKSLPENVLETTLDLSDLASGVYIVRAGGEAVKIEVY